MGTLAGTSLDVLVVDRASAGRRFGRREGVGLARKIGFDVALALHARGAVRSPLLFGTDADATLPDAHFERGELEARGGVAAVVFPFWHAPAADAALTRATASYEASLRYYVAGLAWAGSPYAFHTVGSALAVRAGAYAAVRGVPRREAAEDFYLLGKLAKVGEVVRAGGAPIVLAARASDRTPFGTGAAVSLRLAGARSELYAPRCFEVLRTALALLAELAEAGDTGGFAAALDAEPEDARAALGAVFTAPVLRALAATLAGVRAAEERRRRVHAVFDAFRTRKLVHAVRRAGNADLPFEAALRTAPFVPRGVPDDGDPEITGLRRALTLAEVVRAVRPAP